MENKFKTLTKKSDFFYLKEKGERLHLNNWLFVNYEKLDQKELLCGWTISRSVGNAVIRNKLKRYLRTYFRNLISKNIKKGIKVNFIFKSQKEDSFFKNMKQEKLFHVLGQFIKKAGVI